MPRKHLHPNPDINHAEDAKGSGRACSTCQDLEFAEGFCVFWSAGFVALELNPSACQRCRAKVYMEFMDVSLFGSRQQLQKTLQGFPDPPKTPGKGSARPVLDDSFAL